MAVLLANKLSKHEGVVFCCTYGADGPLRARLKSGIPLHQLHKKPGFDLGAVVRLRRLVLDDEIELVHAHSFSVFIALFARFLILNGRSPKIVWHDHSGGNFQRLVNKPFLSALPLLFASRLVDKILVVDERSRSWFTGASGKEEKVSLLRNFVDAPRSLETRTSPLPGVEGERIVQVANIRRVKDHRTALLAVSIIAKEFPGVKLFVAGKVFEEDYFAELQDLVGRKQLQQNVSFLGMVHDIPSLLRSVDIGLLSSVQEGTPLSLLEYGSMRLPVVVTDVGECASIVENGVSGFVVERSRSRIDGRVSSNTSPLPEPSS